MTTFDDLFAFIDTLGDEYRLLTARSSAPNEAAIATTEAQLGFALPPDYRDFVARYGALYLEVIEEVWRRPQALEIRPLWQMCFALWVHGIAEHPDLSLISQRQPGFAPVLRIAGLGLRDAIGYDNASQLVRSTESALVPAGGTLAGHLLAAARQLAADRERLRTEPIAPPSAEPPPARRSTITLRLQAAADAIPAALRRALDEVGGTSRVEVCDDDGKAHPAELDAFVTQDAVLNVVIDGREFEVVASTPLATGNPLSVFIQSVADPTSDPLAAATMDAFEHALAAIGTVVERSTNF
jgi:hypothetical protein